MKTEETCKCGKPLDECQCQTDGDCECGGNCGHHQPSMDELVYNNHVVLNSLIDLMLEKKLITKEELQKRVMENLGVEK
jgi:hypothetical protein